MTEKTEDSKLVSCGGNVNEEHGKASERKDLYEGARNLRVQRWEEDKTGGPFLLRAEGAERVQEIRFQGEMARCPHSQA